VLLPMAPREPLPVLTEEEKAALRRVADGPKREAAVALAKEGLKAWSADALEVRTQRGQWWLPGWAA
jgi:hypothetical protein